MFQWVEVGNAQHPGDQRPRARTTPGAHRNPVFFRPANEIRNDQKVTGKSHVADYREFVGQPLSVRSRGALLIRSLCFELLKYPGQRHVQPRFCLRPEIFLRRLTGRNGKRRQIGLAQLEIKVATLRDLQSIQERLRHIGKQRGHLVTVFQVLVFAVEFRSFCIAQRASILNAHSCLVRFKILTLQETYIIARDDRHTHAAGKPECTLHIPFLAASSRTYEFQVEAVAKHIEPTRQSLFGDVVVIADQCPAHVTLYRARQGDKPCAAFPR